jgi:hypothetical protein
MSGSFRNAAAIVPLVRSAVCSLAGTGQWALGTLHTRATFREIRAG